MSEKENVDGSDVLSDFHNEISEALPFDISQLNFDSMNKGIRDILGVKSQDDALFEGYKNGSVSQDNFDREMVTRLEATVGKEVDPSGYAKGDFSLPKAYTPEMLAVVSAYTGIPLEAFYNDFEDGDLLESLLEQQRLEREREERRKLSEAERLRLEEEERLRREEEERLRLEEEERLRLEEEERLRREEEERLRLEEEERLRFEEEERRRLEEEERLRLEEERRRLEEEELRRLEEERRRIEEERLRLEEEERLRLEEERRRLEEEERLRLEEEERLRLEEEERRRLEEEMFPVEFDEIEFDEEASAEEAQELAAEFVSSLPDDTIQDMDISPELQRGVKTDIYSLNRLVSNREAGKI